MLKLKGFGLTFTLDGKHTLSNERYQVFQSFLLFECSSLENKSVWHASASVNMGVFQSNKRSQERSRVENHMNLPSEAAYGTLRFKACLCRGRMSCIDPSVSFD